MKKILFITPGLGLGGTNPSLEALYSSIKSSYEVSVFAIAHQSRCREYLFDEVLLPQSFALSLLYTDFGYQTGWYRIVAFFYKATQSLLSCMGVNLLRLVAKRVVRRIESVYNFDTIVAYQEGFATEFGSLFQNPNKIAWIHCNYDNWMPKDKSEELLYRLYSHIVCVSEYTASVFSNRYPSLKERVIGFYNVVDSDNIKKQGDVAIDDERFDTKRFTILSAGRFHNVKRFREIPRIASLVKKKVGDINWVIIGRNNDQTEMAVFEERLHEYHVESNVKWLGGKSNPYPYFKAADLYVCTSESEACPMVFIEAKILGLPIVTTNFPSSYEFIDNNVNGLIVSLESISDAISELISNKELYARIKKEVKDFKYNKEEHINKIKAIL